MAIRFVKEVSQRDPSVVYKMVLKDEGSLNFKHLTVFHLKADPGDIRIQGGPGMSIADHIELLQEIENHEWDSQ